MHLKEEDAATLQLWEWLVKHQIRAFVNSEKRFDGNLPFFTSTGTGNKRGDMLIKFIHPYFETEECALVEIKTGSSKNLRDSSKILEYYQDVSNSRIKYFIGETEVKPTYFLIATENSLQGKLFTRDVLLEKVRLVDEAKMMGVPMKEYAMTHEFFRDLIAKKWKPVKHKDYKIGILLSDALNGGTGKPALFIQDFNFRLEKWLPPHRFFVIGESL